MLTGTLSPAHPLLHLPAPVHSPSKPQGHWLFFSYSQNPLSFPLQTPNRGSACEQSCPRQWPAAGRSGGQASREHEGHSQAETPPGPGEDLSFQHAPRLPTRCPQVDTAGTHLDISRCSQTKALFFEVNCLKALHRCSIFRGPFH